MTQTYTNATVIIAATDQAAAQADMGSAVFITPASPTGAEPATHYFTSGPWSNVEMDKMADDVAWKKKVRTPEWPAALAAEGLQMIVPPDPAQ